MSRAFVKESDSEQPDDLPERPVSAHPNYVTTSGLEALHARLRQVEAQLAAVEEGRMGGLLERATLAREKRWLQARVGSAIVRPAPADRSRVDFGAWVELVDEADWHYRYRIVGEDEADPERGLVSWISPLAQALKGARVGDEVLWPRPAGDLRVEVLAVIYEFEG